MAGNNMGELNALLFDEMRRLSEAGSGEEIKAEVERARAMTSVASSVIKGASVTLQAAQMRADHTHKELVMPRMLEG